MKSFRPFVIFALTLLPITAFGQAAPATRPAPALKLEAPNLPSPKVQRNGNPDAGFQRLHTQYVANAKAGNIDLYMEGDSITDFWEHNHKANWQKNLGGWKAGDFGISGDRTQHVLWRIENGELDGVTPKVIVLLIGTNNLPANNVYAANTVDDTFLGYKAIVDKLNEKEPQAHILLIGVMPRQDKPLAKQISDLNDKIATLADGSQIKYLNFNDKLTGVDGKLLPGVMLKDNLHPSDKGYDIWANAMKPILTEWLGPPAPTTQP
jgi:lysophospholipase L1-like esterase